MNDLLEMLSSKIRAEIFRLLFGVTDESLHMREIARRSECAIGTIQAELKLNSAKPPNLRFHHNSNGNQQITRRPGRRTSSSILLGSHGTEGGLPS